ncbi:MAG: restriction endonuclease subunit S, partial [Eubacterium sp.]
LYRLTRIETISDRYINEDKVGFSNEQPDDSYLLIEGDILYSNINSISHIGKTAQYKGNSILYHGINLLRLSPKINISSNFLFQLLSTDDKINWAKAHANKAVSQASINKNSLSHQQLLLPAYKEQEQIGAFFLQIDHLITLHQRKLDHLQLQKKALLQQMFV